MPTAFAEIIQLLSVFSLTFSVPTFAKALVLRFPGFSGQRVKQKRPTVQRQWKRQLWKFCVNQWAGLCLVDIDNLLNFKLRITA